MSFDAISSYLHFLPFTSACQLCLTKCYYLILTILEAYSSYEEMEIPGVHEKGCLATIDGSATFVTGFRHGI